ncbi:hypothetical protein [Adhaeretor mobilis]|uniref:Uncharacterized protein n=1 Tax=Adhaeretor mobilis TaxID=1930276 RepID=A0A517MU17_9BACT|nr:hypothetical protein [Adhaeretor mobilis]QDS98378.1 hypothetical protein HG15A2_16520 [Adhaeretor mobilis]
MGQAKSQSDASLRFLTTISGCWSSLIGKVVVAVGMLTAISVNQVFADSPALLDDMAGSRPTLRLANADENVRLLSQSLIENGGRKDSVAERIQISAPPGQTAEIVYQLPQATVIDELAISVWLRCNRPGIRLAARVTLPRTKNPETGKPFQLLLVGETHSQGPFWERLELRDLSRELARQARVSRAKYGQLIDERGAVLQQLVILTPGAAGATELVVDEVALYGVLKTRPGVTADTSRVKLASHGEAIRGELPARPSIPRVLQWQGEPFQLVRSLGFDAASLDRLPTSDELSEAREAGLYLVCPPPSIGEMTQHGITSRYDGVLLWDMADLSRRDQIDALVQQKEELSRFESLAGRETLLRPHTNLRQASRVSDLLLVGHGQAGSTSSLSDFSLRLNGQQRHACPGSRFWLKLNTQYAEGQMKQLTALNGSQGGAVDYREMTEIAFASLGCRPRGFYFESRESLASASPETKKRAAIVELANLRLGLAEPWLRSGKPGSARSSQPNLSAITLDTERSYLLAPVHWSGRLDSAPPVSSQSPVSFLVPGVPESIDAYLLDWSGPKILRTQRVTGGVQVTIDLLPSDALLLMTQDPRAVAQVGGYLRKHAARATKLRLDLARLELAAATRAIHELPRTVADPRALQPTLQHITTLVTRSDTQRQESKYATSLASLAQAESLLQTLADQLAGRVTGESPTGEYPWLPRWSTLTAINQLSRSASTATAEPRHLPAGQFESLEELMGSGWRHLQHESEGLTTSVRLSGEAPVQGNYCLELECRPTLPESQLTPAATPPVWVTSPGLPIRGGQLVEITGRLRVPQQPLGVQAELLIFDSLGGESSALRIQQSPSWRAFRILRVAPEDGPMNLTIALGGAGMAQVDDLKMRVLSQATPAAASQSLPSAQAQPPRQFRRR